MDPNPTTATDEDYGAFDKAVTVVMVAGIIMNLVIMWDYVKDRPQVMIFRQRVKNWWKREVDDPAEAARTMRRAEGETVFEAIGIVEEAEGGG